MKAFYVPELNSNALRVGASRDDPSVAVNQLMKAAAGAQLVRKFNLTRKPHLCVVLRQFSQSLWEWCLERQRTR